MSFVRFFENWFGPPHWLTYEEAGRHSALFFPLERLCRNPENRTRVILSDSEGSAFSPVLVSIGIVFRIQKVKKQILRRSTPQNDIATQSLTGKDKGRGDGLIGSRAPLSLPFPIKGKGDRSMMQR